MNTVEIAVMGGDGIGPEVMAAALAVLERVDQRHQLGLRYAHLQAGAFAYRDTGTDLSDETFGRAASADAILLGAMGWPGIRHADGTELAPQITLRQRLGLFGGVRPIRAIPGVPLPLVDPRAASIDFLILRESTEGLFFSKDRGRVSHEQAEETLRMTRNTSVALAHLAFDLARQRSAERGRPSRVTLVDKANVFRSFAWLRAIFVEVAQEYPDVPHDAAYVDAMALDLLRRPWDFDVLPTENMFGDILSDLAAGLIGGMGFAPSADLGERHAVFQPSHGTAPDIAGRGLANPTAMILSAAMMLEWLGARHEAQRFMDAAKEIRLAVDRIFSEGLRTADLGGRAGTSDAAGAVLACLAGQGAV